MNAGCEHGIDIEKVCAKCGRGVEPVFQTRRHEYVPCHACGMACEVSYEHTCPEPATSDVRALLWALAYAGRRYDMRGCGRGRDSAIEEADEAVADFDKHYLGRKPSKEQSR